MCQARSKWIICRDGSGDAASGKWCVFSLSSSTFFIAFEPVSHRARCPAAPRGREFEILSCLGRVHARGEMPAAGI